MQRKVLVLTSIVEFVFVMLGLFVLGFIDTLTPPENLGFVPNAITGLTTLSGILTALTGFWLTHLYQNNAEPDKNWLKVRLVLSMFLLFISLASVMGALMRLAYAEVWLAYKYSIGGTIVILLLFADVFLLTVMQYMAENYEMK